MKIKEAIRAYLERVTRKPTGDEPSEVQIHLHASQAKWLMEYEKPVVAGSPHHSHFMPWEHAFTISIEEPLPSEPASDPEPQPRNPDR